MIIRNCSRGCPATKQYRIMTGDENEKEPLKMAAVDSKLCSKWSEQHGYTTRRPAGLYGNIPRLAETLNE